MPLDSEYSTRDRIIDVSIEMFASKGYGETSMRDIASATGVRASSIYNYFASKYEIMQAILQNYSDILHSGVPRCTPVKIDKKKDELTTADLSAMMFFQFPPEKYEQYRNIQKIIYSEQARNPEIAAFFRTRIIDSSFGHIRSVLESLAEQGYIPPLNVDCMASALYSLVMSFTVLNTMGSPQMEVGNEETGMFAIVEYLLQMVLDGKA